MVKKNTVTDYIYEKILNDIVSLHYLPGEKLSEVQLANRFNVSRDPVKRAFIRLEQEELVEIIPQFGTIVSEISIDKGKQICDVRLLLEPYATEIATKTITKGQMKKLENAFNKLNLLDKGSEEYSKYISELDILLHNTIYEASGNLIIRDVNHLYAPHIQRIRRANITWVNRLEPSRNEMTKIYEALQTGDPKKSAKAMYEHISNIKAAIEKLHN